MTPQELIKHTFPWEPARRGPGGTVMRHWTVYVTFEDGFTAQHTVAALYLVGGAALELLRQHGDDHGELASLQAEPND